MNIMAVLDKLDDYLRVNGILLRTDKIGVNQWISNRDKHKKQAHTAILAEIVKGLPDFQQVMIDISSWSDATFGNGQRTVPILHHLKKEVKELIKALKIFYEKPNTEGRVWEEFADCFMLLFDAAHHFGLSAKDIFEAMRRKLEINKQRKWGKPNKDGVVEHIKTPLQRPDGGKQERSGSDG